ncbi:maltokinase N-terminal cap-like domain-containing protein [Streptomyces boninensis]|uniref:maltokinase N-terminal cap-like domain-containing protein n=1 Tax=Streptomyces boninensis TaxID=2039455 RepID=UPI003B20B7F1
MAIIHHTTMKPTKLELLAEWLPKQPWYVGEPGARPELAKAGGFRLDDPAGVVGIEFMVVNDTAGERPVSYHVPMTYRSEPLPGGALVGTSEHGVLGLRRLYDATTDPVFRAEVRALLAGTAVAQMQSVNDTPDPTVTARLDAGAEAGEGAITVCRVLHPAPADAGAARGDITAGWKLPDGTEARGRFVVLG